MPVRISSNGAFNTTDSFLRRLLRVDIASMLSAYGELGVQALSSATPVDTGDTSESWDYKVVKNGNGSYSLVWTNSNVDEAGQMIAILIQYGHATGNGGYVEGRDYINPAIQPIFDKIAADIWKEVKRS